MGIKAHQRREVSYRSSPDFIMPKINKRQAHEDSPQAQTVNLTQGNFKPQLLKLAAPIIGTSFIQMAYTFTDMAWVGRLGSRELAAVGAIGIITWLATSAGITVKLGAEVCVAQSLGAKDYERAKRYVSHNVTLGIILALAVVLLLMLLGPLVIGLYRLEADIFGMAMTYLYILLPAFVPVFISFALSGSYNATGHSKVPFKINSVGLIANMVLDPVLIFLFGWGTAGAAVGTVIAQTLVCTLFLREIRHGKKLISEGYKLLTRLKKEETHRIFRIGMPAALLNALYAFVTFFMGTLASRAGGHIGVAVINTGGQLEAISWNTSLGFSTALGAFVGQNYAAGKWKRIFGGYRFIMLITQAIGVLTTLFYFFFGEAFFSLIAPDPEAYLEGGRYFRIVALSQLFVMAEITTQGLFYGTSRSIIPSTISIMGNLLRIPLTFAFLALGWELASVWWAISLTCIIKGIVAVSFIPYLKRRIVKETA